MGFIFKPWNRLSLFTRIMIGFVLGIVLGLVLGPRAEVLKPLGTILTNLLTMVVAPLVFTLLVCAAADVGDGKRLGRIGIKTVIIFLVSTALAIVLGLVVSNMMNIGAGVELSNVAAPQPKGQAPASMLDTVINIIPVNIFASLAKQNLLQIIFFALIMGFALLKLGDKGKALLDCCRAGQEVMKEITNMALEFTPYGVLGLMASVVGKNGTAILIPYIKTIGAMYLCAVVYLLVVQAVLMVGVCGRVSPVKFLKNMKEAITFVFATCSSVATIPLNLACVKKVGVDEETANNAEKPMIAGMYLNRLNLRNGEYPNGMPLQADPTIKFAWQKFELKRIYNKLLSIDSPYNTYRRAGLPPGPIRIPTVAGIDAVLNYAHHNYLYMCAKEDFSGTHNFAATYSEHLQNAARYSKALNSRGIQ